MISLRIKDLNNCDKPRERIIEKGANVLTDIELLAIVLRTGGKENSALALSGSLLKEFGGLKDLVKADIGELRKFKDIGSVKAAEIKAICEIALRIGTENSSAKIPVKVPRDAYEILKKDFYAKTKEHLYLISLDTRNQFISKDLISIGTVNETLVHPREIYRQALAKNAVSIILAHNHPSQDPTPSTEDILITERVAKAGISIGIALVDHIIVCDDKFTSLKSLNLFTSIKFNQNKSNEKGGE